MLRTHPPEYIRSIKDLILRLERGVFYGQKLNKSLKINKILKKTCINITIVLQ